MTKKCPKCLSNKNKKNWKRQGKQRYLCNSCWYVWEHWKPKDTKTLNLELLFEWYCSKVCVWSVNKNVDS